jgi:hypothetical protein
MKWLFRILLIFLPLQLVAQKVYIYPTEAIAPRGSYQTVTVVVNGVNDKTVSWTSSGGRIVGANPCVINEPCTIALYSKEEGTFHLKATSNANHSVAAESTITFAPSPTPVTSHPRLMVTAAMLPAIRSRATPRNVAYQSLKSLTENYLERDNAVWSWSCKGGNGQPKTDQSAGYKEGVANLYAFLSMVAPTQAERDAWGCYARDEWVYVMQAVISGKEEIRGNHWSDSAPQFSLTTDWLMAGNYLSASDLELARRFHAYFAKTVLAIAYGATPLPGNYNSQAQFQENEEYSLVGMRGMGNNYTMSKMLVLVGAGLTFNNDPTDDPNLPNTCHAKRDEVCPDYSAGSLHAYYSYFTGAMLYRMYGHLEDPAVTLQAYQVAFSNLPQPPKCMYLDGRKYPCLGDGRGGESAEGSWYQYSLYRLRYALNMLHTAGYNDPILYGPQMSLDTSSWWDMKYVSDLLFLTGVPPEGSPSQPSYNYLTTGDSLQYVRVPSDFLTEASMMTADSYVGRKDRTEALKWLLVNTAFGGPLGKNHCKSYCGFNSELSNDYASNLTFDLVIATTTPDLVASLPADPRPSLPMDLYNGSFNQHTMVRTNGHDGSVLFSTYCPNTLTDHEHQFCGRFDIFSNGEYITKGRTEFNDYNDVMSSATQSNTLSVQNVTGSACKDPNTCFMYAAVQNGGQFWHSLQEGFNLITHSELPSYAAFLYNDTPSYNGWWVSGTPHDVPDYNDVTKVSRSMVYLRDTNQLIYYDRAATRHASAKAVFQIATGEPTVSGNEATWLTRSGKQRAYFTGLLPAQATVAGVNLIQGREGQQADWEPAANIKLSAGNPTAVQYLSVLEWGSTSMHKSPTSVVESTAGQSFDGAKVGSSVVMFMRDWPANFTSATYPASGATTQYVSDLQPNMPFQIAGDGAPASGHSDSAGVLTFSSAGTGNIRITASQ